jgi:hypothetical protein
VEDWQLFIYLPLYFETCIVKIMSVLTQKLLTDVAAAAV